MTINNPLDIKLNRFYSEIAKTRLRDERFSVTPKLF